MEALKAMDSVSLMDIKTLLVWYCGTKGNLYTVMRVKEYNKKLKCKFF